MTSLAHSEMASLLERVILLARAAGDVVMTIYQTDFAVVTKLDNSPVTVADRQAEKVIFAGLQTLLVGTPVVAEEAASAGRIPDVGARFWLVDPIDGTREFVSRNGEFTVNIALVERGRPVLGVVYAPVLGRMFSGAEGVGAWVEDEQGLRTIATREVPADGLTVVGSRWHGDVAAVKAFLAGRVVARQLTVGSSLKLCLVAEGVADVYPRFGRTMEWDIAAGDAVLRAAGGSIATVDGRALAYGKPGFENPDFAAWGVFPLAHPA